MLSEKPSGPKARLDWCRDELLLALNVYFSLHGAVPTPQRKEIRDLSALLRSSELYPSEKRPANFRSPSSVVMKLMNFRSIDPNYGGKGLAAGNRLDREVWSDMAIDRKRLSEVAEAIRTILVTAKESSAPVTEPWVAEAEEGALLTRLHLTRERNGQIVKSKKSEALRRSGKLSCEVCGFCFAEVYGPLGSEFIECHHRRPLSELCTRRRTVLADLALICANCHRMIHARRPWLSVEELRMLLRPGDIGVSILGD